MFKKQTRLGVIGTRGILVLRIFCTYGLKNNLIQNPTLYGSVRSVINRKKNYIGFKKRTIVVRAVKSKTLTDSGSVTYLNNKGILLSKNKLPLKTKIPGPVVRNTLRKGLKELFNQIV